MHIQKDIVPFPHIIIDNFLNSNEIENFFKEFNFIEPVMNPPEKTLTAWDGDKNNKILLKNNKAVFLEELYNNFDMSFILSKMYSFSQNPEVQQACNLRFGPLFKYFSRCNKLNTLVSYYEHRGFYEAHQDSSLFTALLWLYKEPRKFSGGEVNFYYEDKKYKPEYKSNRLFLFPSIVTHEVDEVIMSEEDTNKGLGRYTITMFMNSNT